jgi:enoyl-CoA hydratase/carnithine racemase
MTGRLIDANEALRAGLVSRVLPAETLLEETLATAKKISEYSLPALMMMKEAVNRAYESPLSEGIWFERRMLHASFALQDQKEGMQAFVEKRTANFVHR